MYHCKWAQGHPLLEKYHDHEWGIPVHDERKLFEFLVLDAFQAGLSWLIILKKREAFREAFDDFDYHKIANYNNEKIMELLNNPGIIRNKLKINGTVANAKAFIQVRQKFGSFDKYIWQFVNYNTIINRFKDWRDIPPNSRESDNMSKGLKKLGFKFVGTTICYSFMQAAGMVNDHEVTCFRYNQVQ